MDPTGYPLIYAPKEDPKWGAPNTFKSPKNEFDGWIWLLPPSGPLPDGFKVGDGCNVQILRRAIGYMCPPGSDAVETAIPVCLLSDQTIIPLPRTLDEALFLKWENIAIKAGNKGKLFGWTVPIVASRLYR